MDCDDTFEQSASGSSLTYPLSAGEVRKGGFIVINGRL